MAGLFFDENAATRAVVQALRSRTTVELAIHHLPEGASDDEQLQKATELGLVLYTFDADDFPRIHAEWLSVARSHAGIILNPWRDMPIGEQIRLLRSALPSIEAGELRDSLSYLTNWR